MKNAITDIPGIKVGHAQNEEAITGCTVILTEDGAVAGVEHERFFEDVLGVDRAEHLPGRENTTTRPALQGSSLGARHCNGRGYAHRYHPFTRNGMIPRY